MLKYFFIILCNIAYNEKELQKLLYEKLILYNIQIDKFIYKNKINLEYTIKKYNNALLTCFHLLLNPFDIPAIYNILINSSEIIRWAIIVAIARTMVSDAGAPFRFIYPATPHIRSPTPSAR